MVRTTAKSKIAKSSRPVAKPIVANAGRMASDPDAQLLALEAEIDRLYAAAAQINRERVDPHAEQFETLTGAWLKSRSKADADAMTRFGKESGREAAIDDADKFLAKASASIEAMLALKPASDAGRAAKARVFFRHVALDQFKGPDSELDWDMSLARQLLLDYAGMTQADAVRLTGKGDMTGSRLADPKDQEKSNELPQCNSPALSPMEFAYAEWSKREQ